MASKSTGGGIGDNTLLRSPRIPRGIFAIIAVVGSESLADGRISLAEATKMREASAHAPETIGAIVENFKAYKIVSGSSQ
jgi:hypothetical protein